MVRFNPHPIDVQSDNDRIIKLNFELLAQILNAPTTKTVATKLTGGGGISGSGSVSGYGVAGRLAVWLGSAFLGPSDMYAVAGSLSAKPSGVQAAWFDAAGRVGLGTVTNPFFTTDTSGDMRWRSTSRALFGGTGAFDYVGIVKASTSDLQLDVSSGSIVLFPSTNEAVFNTSGVTLRSLSGLGNSVVLASNAGLLSNTPVLGASLGGTGNGSYAVGDFLYATGSTTLSRLALGSADQVLAVNHTATGPEYKSLLGTTNRLTATPASGSWTFDISAAYVGQTSITTLGTITTGTWNATAVDYAHGGTGLVNVALGDTLYGASGTSWARLTGNTSSTMAVLTQTGTGSASAAPVWTTTTGTAGAVVLSVSPTFTGTVNAAALTLSGDLTISTKGRWGATAGNMVLGNTTLDSTSWLNIGGTTGLAGTTNYGGFISPVFQSNATAAGYVLGAQLRTQATAFSMTAGAALKIFNVGLGAGSSLGTQIGIDIDALSGATTNIALRASGSSLVQFAGNTQIGGTTDNGFKLEVTGTFKVSSTATFGGTIATALTASRTVITDGSGNLAINTETGTGSHVRANSPTVDNLTVTTKIVVQGYLQLSAASAPTAFLVSAEAVAYGSQTGGGSYPFTENGNLILQARSATSGNERDIVFAVGSAGAAFVAGAVKRTSGNLTWGGTTDNGYKVEVTGTGKFSGLLTLASSVTIQGSAPPSSGASLELDYGGIANTGRILAYDRTGAVYKTLQVQGSTYFFSTGRAAFGGSTDNGFQVEVTGTFKASGAATFGSTVTASGTISTTSGASFFVDNSGGGVYTGSSVGDVKFYARGNTGNTIFGNTTDGERMRLTPGGLLGIACTPVFPLDIEILTGNINAKFGSTFPLYIESNWPGLGLNAYYSSGWKFGKGSVSGTNYGGVYEFNVTNGTHTWYSSNATGNADAAITLTTLKTLDRSGNMTVTAQIATGNIFYASGTGARQVQLNSSGANYGTIQSDAANTWSLGYSSSSGTGLGTAVLKWNSSGNVNLPGLNAAQAVFTDGSNNLVSNAISGTGSVAMTTSPVFTTPTLGAASATSINFGQTSLNYYEEGSFTGTWTGMTTATTATIKYIRIGKIVILSIPAKSGTSNAATFTITGLPAAVTPASNTVTSALVSIIDNGNSYEGFFTIGASGTVLTANIRNALTGYISTFTSSGSKGTEAGKIIYTLD